MEAKLRIGDVAAAARVNVQTLRYYERLKILGEPFRTSGGFRLYTKDTIRRIRFIKRAQALGFSLEEVRELLALEEAPSTLCREMRSRLDSKISTIQDMIQHLTRLQDALTVLSRRCPDDQQPREACPILESLLQEEPSP